MPDDELRSAQASSFGVAAAEYERGRPTYPAAALDWLLPPGVRRVADVGAGTGKLTRLVVARGLDVVAVEPSEGMREQLARSVPGVPVLAGTAEEIPLPDGGSDAVLMAQAWHWVDPGRALPEVGRVLTAGGWLGLMWNLRDESVPWVARLGRIMHATDSGPGDSPPTFGPPFGPPERTVVRWVNHLSPDQLVDMVASRSYVITQPPAGRAAILDGVRNLLETDPALAGRPDIPLPYTTVCFRARRA